MGQLTSHENNLITLNDVLSWQPLKQYIYAHACVYIHVYTHAYTYIQFKAY